MKVSRKVGERTGFDLEVVRDEGRRRYFTGCHLE